MAAIIEIILIILTDFLEKRYLLAMCKDNFNYFIALTIKPVPREILLFKSIKFKVRQKRIVRIY